MVGGDCGRGKTGRDEGGREGMDGLDCMGGMSG